MVMALVLHGDHCAVPPSEFRFGNFPTAAVEYAVSKLVLVFHNVPTFHKLYHAELLPPPSVILRGRIWYEGEWVFRTRLSQSYPPGMAKEMADNLVEALAMRDLALKEGRQVAKLAKTRIKACRVCGVP